MKQAHDYRKYNVRLTSADWQRGSGRVINTSIYYGELMLEFSTRHQATALLRCAVIAPKREHVIFSDIFLS